MIVGLKQLRGFYLVILDKEVASAFSAFILFESSMIGVMVCKFISVVLHRGFFYFICTYNKLFSTAFWLCVK